MKLNKITFLSLLYLTYSGLYTTSAFGAGKIKSVGYDQLALGYSKYKNPSEEFDKKQINQLLDIHLDRLGITNTLMAKNNLKSFAMLVGEIENSSKTYGSNKLSSAEGLYQFLTKNRGSSNKENTSLEVAINRTSKYIGVQDWMSQAEKYSSVNPADNFSGLSREQQKILFFGDLFEKYSSDELMIGVINGEKESFLKAYYKLHHTNPDQASIKRAESVIGWHFFKNITEKSVGLEKT